MFFLNTNVASYIWMLRRAGLSKSKDILDIIYHVVVMYGWGVAGVVFGALGAAALAWSVRYGPPVVRQRLALKRTRYLGAAVSWTLAWLAMLVQSKGISRDSALKEPALEFLVWVNLLFNFFVLLRADFQLKEKQFPPSRLFFFQLPDVELSADTLRKAAVAVKSLWVILVFSAFTSVAGVCSRFNGGCRNSHTRAAAVLEFFLFASLLVGLVKSLQDCFIRYEAINRPFLWLEAAFQAVIEPICTSRSCSDLKCLAASSQYIVLDWKTESQHSIISSSLVGYNVRYRESRGRHADPQDSLLVESVWQVLHTDGPPVKIQNLEPGREYNVEMPVPITIRSERLLARRREIQLYHNNYSPSIVNASMLRALQHICNTGDRQVHPSTVPRTNNAGGRDAADDTLDPGTAAFRDKGQVFSTLSEDGVEECPFCCEERGPEEMLSLPDCHNIHSEKICNECWARTIREAMGDRASHLPLKCPMCKTHNPQCYELPQEAVQEVFKASKKMAHNMQLTDRELQRFIRMTRMMRVPEAERVECPREQCAEIMQLPRRHDPVADGGEDGTSPGHQLECTSCRVDFCLSCKASPYHIGITCQERRQKLEQHRQKLEELKARDIERQVQRRRAQWERQQRSRGASGNLGSTFEEENRQLIEQRLRYSAGANDHERVRTNWLDIETSSLEALPWH